MSLPKKAKNQILIIFFFIVFFLLLTDSKNAVSYASNGLLVWFHTMIPTLFPFMILSGILVRTGLSEKIAGIIEPFLGKIFSLQKQDLYIILMGFLCGFPMGAAVISESLSLKKISKQEGQLLLAFCNNIGPVYFIGYVMQVCPLSPKWPAFLIMYLIPLLYGWFLRHFIMKKEIPYSFNLPQTKKKHTKMADAIEQSVNRAVDSITKLGAYMIIFNVCNLIFFNRYFSLPASLQGIIGCLLEISGGIGRLTTQKAFYPIAYILLPFGGFCCIAQTFSIIKECDLSIKEYTFHKIMQSIFTAAIYAFFYGFSVFVSK